MDLYTLATAWETIDDSKRTPLKDMIRGLVGYDCKIAAEAKEDCVNLFIWSVNKRKITDWIEMQPSGAVGVIFDEYPNAEAPAVVRVSDACDDYNDAHGLEFSDSGDSDNSDSSDSSSESGSSDSGNKEKDSNQPDKLE